MDILNKIIYNMSDLKNLLKEIINLTTVIIFFLKSRFIVWLSIDNW